MSRVGKGVIVHGLLEVDGIEDFDPVRLIDDLAALILHGLAVLAQLGCTALEHFTALHQNGAFGIGDYIGTVHLHEGGFDEKTGLAAATAADDQDVLFRAYLGFFGRLDMVSFSVWVRGMFQSGIGST